jgi:hypothetical protein
MTGQDFEEFCKRLALAVLALMFGALMFVCGQITEGTKCRAAIAAMGSDMGKEGEG